jgi:hypothetical protein
VTDPVEGFRMPVTDHVLDWTREFYRLKGGAEHLACSGTKRKIPENKRRVYTYGGFVAEILAAWHFGIPWPSILPGARTVQGLTDPDIGARTQVRMIEHPRKNLFVRDQDLEHVPDHNWVLVYLDTDPDGWPKRTWFGVIVGWCSGEFVQRNGRRNATVDAYSDAEAAPAGVLIPRTLLASVDTLAPGDV